MNFVEYQKMFEIEEKHWWYVGKRKIVSALLKKFISNKKDNRILDIGCGTSRSSDKNICEFLNNNFSGDI